MMHIFCRSLIVITLLASLPGVSQNIQKSHKVFLLGNTADIPLESGFYEAIQTALPANESFTVLVNGDIANIGSGQLPSESDSLKIRKLLEAIVGKENGNVVILPGDRDWSSSGKKGWQSVRALESMVKKMGFRNVDWAVSKGCPGPSVINLSEILVLVAINTQWWNHPYGKPTAESAECKFGTERDFLIELENVIEDTEDKNILVAGHFPLESLGEYGGRFPFLKELAPPIYGSFRVGFRQNIGTSVDIVNSRFDDIRGRIDNILQSKGSVIYASGHEKNLQILESGHAHLVNSGSPVQSKYVSKDKDHTTFAGSIPGFISLDYAESGKVDFSIYRYDGGKSLSVVKQGTLLHSACEDKLDSDNFNSALIPCKEEFNITVVDSRGGAEQVSRSGGNYPARGLKKVFFGSHYRSTWKAPVQVPYLDLENTFGGLSVYAKGGGHQTTSLKLKGGDGKEYAFRSVDKDPIQLIPFELQNTVIADIMRDATSMQHPYGAMAIGSMLDATDILHARPSLYVLPPSDLLGPFNRDYSNLFGMLEEKPINVKKVKIPFANADEILQSRKMFGQLYKDHDNQIDAGEYAKARLFDILVGDWGKHEDNWKWAGYKKEHGFMYRPIPRDRDYVFTRWDGFFFYLLDRKWGNELGENFDYTINDLRSLTWASRHADRRLLNELAKEDWLEAANYIQSQITDEVIEKAVKNMPSEVYNIAGVEIEKKLKQRVRDLPEYAEQFYEQLMIGGVDVVGSNKREYFEVTRKEDGKVRVTMHNIPKDSNVKGERLYYDRTFDPKETKEIRLYGLDGKDIFDISGSAKRSILVKVIGGPEPDKIEDHSEVKSGGRKTFIYEKGKTAEIDLGKEGKMINHWDKSLYNYNRHQFEYNRYLPLFSMAYNSTNGFGVKAGVNFTRKKYGKQDYSAKHAIGVIATTENVNIVNYSARFHHVLGRWDFILKGIFADHNDFKDFFGIGNGTIKVDSLNNIGFYEARYDTYGVRGGLEREFWNKSSFSVLLSYENNESVIRPGTILDDPAQENSPGLGELNLTEVITELDLDFRDRSDLPQRGIRLYIKNQIGINSNSNDNTYGLSSASLEKYFTTRSKIPTTLALRFGGSRIFRGEEIIPFYRLYYLGQLNGLRGFEKNRFTGKSTLFLNTEIRQEITQFHTSIVPMKFGIKGFFDTGRVYSDFDTSEDFHAGYGFGFYLVPYRESVAISISAAFSEEESALILFAIGSTFR